MELQLTQIRNKLIDSILFVTSVFVLPVVFISLARIFQTGWQWEYLIQAILSLMVGSIYFVRSYLSINFKIHFFSVLLIILSFIGAIKFSVSSTYYLCSIPVIINALVFGKRASIAYASVSIAGLSVIAFAHSFKWIDTKIDFNDYNFNTTTWLAILFVLITQMVIFIFSIGWFYDFYTQNIQKLVKRDQQLEMQNEKYIAINKELTELNVNYRTSIEKAEESENYLRLVAQNFENGIIYQVIMLDEKNRKFTYISQAVEKFYGCTAEQAKADASLIYGRVYKDDEERVQNEEKEALREMRTFRTELRIIDPLGNIRWSHLVSSPRMHKGLVYWSGIELDITQLKKAEQDRELLLSQIITARDGEAKIKKMLYAILERVSDGFVAFDANFNYTYVNSHGGDLLGRKPEDLVGKNYWTEYPEARNTPFANAYVKAMETQEQIIFEDYYVHWDRWFVNRIYPSKEGITIFFTDITKSKKNELEIIEAKDRAEKISSELKLKNQEYESLNEELRQTNEELFIAKEKAEESNLLKSTFLQNMSHEVRTPLNAISGFAHLISNYSHSPEKLQKFSELISSSTEKLIGIITDVVLISQIQTNQVEILRSNFDIIELIENQVQNIAFCAQEKDIELVKTIDIEAKKYIIHSDFEKMDRIVFHLLDNAVKFTEEGTVEIYCNILTINELPMLKISISDTGIGIEPEMQEVIFEPFRQIETGMSRNYGGNGLGLSIVKSYMELLNSSLVVESEIMKGTKMTLLFPLLEVPQETTEPFFETQPSYGIKTVLVAEDEFANYQLLLEMLDEMGMEVEYAANGLQAVKVCQMNDKIDLVLMDIKMPLMDGKTAAQKIKLFRPQLPIIAQTAFALENEKEMFVAFFDDYITKPIMYKDLQSKLKRYISN